MILATSNATLLELASRVAELITLVWLAVQQRLHRQVTIETKKVVTEEVAETKKDVVETRVDIAAIKALLNGDKLALLKERSDHLRTLAELRGAPGDREEYERALQEWQDLQQAHALVLSQAVELQLEALEKARRRD